MLERLATSQQTEVQFLPPAPSPSTPTRRLRIMPGLAVIISPTNKEQNQSALERMVASMRHESFYKVGTYANEALGLYIGWVCHAGSYSDGLPLRSQGGNLILFFYGEHLDDPANDSSLPRPWNARSVLQLFELYGLDALPRLNGWFHGVLVNQKEKTVVVFNDRYGMQRLYCSRNEDSYLFASEAKALLAVRPDLRKIDPRSLAEFLSCGCVLENRTLFDRVGTLPSGTFQTFMNATCVRDARYFLPAHWESQTKLGPDEFYSALQDTLQRAVNRCVDSALPLGMSLTGGFDTRLIMASLHQRNVRLPCYTFGGMYRECFDVKIARKVAAICECDHTVFELGSDFLKSFSGLAEKTILLSDGGLGATNAYELFLNQRARQVAIVRLTGSYGSEVMRGARAFKALPATPGFIHPELRPHMNTAISTFDAASNSHPVSFSVFSQAPMYYYNRLAVEQSQVIVRTPFMDNDFVGLFYRRPEGFEDSRALARRLIAENSPALAALPTDTGNCSFLRHHWAQFLFKADYCYKSGMPQWLEKLHHICGPLQPEKLLIGRHRFAHFRVWFRNQLAPYLKEILLDRRTASRPFFNHSFVERMLHQHINGERNYTDDIERVLTVELTCRQLLDN
jgi:asparagine synthase (glutamine-hydrolysing)